MPWATGRCSTTEPPRCPYHENFYGTLPSSVCSPCCCPSVSLCVLFQRWERRMIHPQGYIILHPYTFLIIYMIWNSPLILIADRAKHQLVLIALEVFHMILPCQPYPPCFLLLQLGCWPPSWTTGVNVLINSKAPPGPHPSYLPLLWPNPTPTSKSS